MPETNPVPSAPPASVPPVDKQKRRARLLLKGGGILAGVFALFVIVMMVLFTQVGPNSSLMRILGSSPAGLKSLLLLVMAIVFGLLAIVLLVVTIIRMRRFSRVKKDDKEGHARALKMLLFGLIPLVLTVLLWVFLSVFISRMEVATIDYPEVIVVVQPADLNNLVAPVEITFSSESVARALQKKGLAIDYASWDLDGTGTFATQPNDYQVSHLYTDRGVYKVGLQVKVMTEDKPRYYYQTINIPNAVFAADPLTGTAPLTVHFDASNLVAKISKLASIDWDFQDDGKFDVTGATDVITSYTFEQIGTYKVHLRLVDAASNVQNYYRDIEVKTSGTPLLSAVITGTPALAGPAPLQVRFDASQSASLKGQLINYQWDFGDGTDLESGKVVTHVFQGTGKYIVTLTVKDDTGKEASSTAEVNAGTLNAPPEAKIKSVPAAGADGTLKIELPLKVAFDASGSTDKEGGIVDFSWDFTGDGKSDQNGQKVDYTFDKAGAFTVTLTVTDSAGLTNQVSLPVEVTAATIKAVIKANPAEGSVPLTVAFDGSSSGAYNGKISIYEWDFGDGSAKTVNGAAISHKYAAVGTYTAKLKVTSNDGQTADTSMQIFVREVPLRACFTPSRTNGPTPLSVAFDATCSTGTIAKYSWDFGDGKTSDAVKPNHIFENIGTYTVTLEVSDDKNNVNVFTAVIVSEGQLQ